MTHDEYKVLLTAVSTATLHAMLSNEKTSLHSASKVVPVAVNVAQQLIDEIDDVLENG